MPDEGFLEEQLMGKTDVEQLEILRGGGFLLPYEYGEARKRIARGEKLADIERGFNEDLVNTADVTRARQTKLLCQIRNIWNQMF